jgi:prolyl-tRNA editing enzyme YbaK/EbsC (Cys-tRNA(Pro) deacylase)
VSPLDGIAVARVRQALAAAGSTARIVELKKTARSAADAARALAVDQGAIVKSLVFVIGGEPVMALVAGDRLLDESQLPPALGLAGVVRRANAQVVRDVTGFAIGGVPPVGSLKRLPTAIDGSLTRFATLYAAAGHPHCVFATTLAELERLTAGILCPTLGRAP